MWDALQTKYGAPDRYPQKTIYDPCPVGYCVGQRQKFYGFTYRNGAYGQSCLYYQYNSSVPVNASEENINAIKQDLSKILHDDYLASNPVGYRFKRSGHDENPSIAKDNEGILFPATGYISSQMASSSHRGSSGNYWSSASYSMAGAYNLNFYSYGVGPQGGGNRAYGFSVRPLREPNL